MVNLPISAWLAKVFLSNVDLSGVRLCYQGNSARSSIQQAELPLSRNGKGEAVC
jgi:hypothetical protein